MDLKKFLAAVGTTAIALLLALGISRAAAQLPLKILNANLAYANFEGLFVLEQGGRTACSRHDLNKWRAYFNQVVHLLPGMAEAWHMRGLCELYLDDRAAAVSDLEKAAALNPRFWAFQYDLGIVYLRQNNVEKARECFQKALATPPQFNAVFIKSSKIYADLIAKSKHTDIDILQRLQEGYRLSFVAAQLTAGAEPATVSAQLPLRLF